MDLAFSDFFLWMNSIKTLLFLKTLPFAFKYKLWYKCLSIFLFSRYFFNNRRKTLILLIHNTFTGILAFAVPFLLPGPVCLPLRRASAFFLTRAREWTATGFLMIKPSLINFLMCCPMKNSQLFLYWLIFSRLTWICVCDFITFIWIKPNFVLTALQNSWSETLLKSQRTKR